MCTQLIGYLKLNNWGVDMEKVVSHEKHILQGKKKKDYNDITYTNVITYFKYIM